MDVAAKLRSLRKASGLSQIELGKKARVSQATISDIERGESRKTGALPALAKALGVSVEEFGTALEPDERQLYPTTQVEPAGLDVGKLTAALEGVLSAFGEVILDPGLAQVLATAVVDVVTNPTPPRPAGLSVSEEDAIRISLQYMALAEMRERRLKLSEEEESAPPKEPGPQNP